MVKKFLRTSTIVGRMGYDLCLASLLSLISYCMVVTPAVGAASLAEPLLERLRLNAPRGLAIEQALRHEWKVEISDSLAKWEASHPAIRDHIQAMRQPGKKIGCWPCCDTYPQLRIQEDLKAWSKREGKTINLKYHGLLQARVIKKVKPEVYECLDHVKRDQRDSRWGIRLAAEDATRVLSSRSFYTAFRYNPQDEKVYPESLSAAFDIRVLESEDEFNRGWDKALEHQAHRTDRENRIKHFGSTRKRAQEGDLDSQYLAGYAYYHGEGVAQDIKVAREWFKKAADRDHVGAMTCLATIYYQNEGRTFEEMPIHERRSAALKWWRRAGDLGFVEAQTEIDKIMDEARKDGYAHKIR